MTTGVYFGRTLVEDAQFPLSGYDCSDYFADVMLGFRINEEPNKVTGHSNLLLRELSSYFFRIASEFDKKIEGGLPIRPVISEAITYKS